MNSRLIKNTKCETLIQDFRHAHAPISTREYEIGDSQLKLTQMPSCCGILVAHGFVAKNLREFTRLCRVAQEMGKKTGYSDLYITLVGKKNIDQARKLGFKTISTVMNSRTDNKIYTLKYKL